MSDIKYRPEAVSFEALMGGGGWQEQPPLPDDYPAEGGPATPTAQPEQGASVESPPPPMARHDYLNLESGQGWLGEYGVNLSDADLASVKSIVAASIAADLQLQARRLLDAMQPQERGGVAVSEGRGRRKKSVRGTRPSEEGVDSGEAAGEV